MHSFLFGSAFCRFCSFWKIWAPPTCGLKHAAFLGDCWCLVKSAVHRLIHRWPPQWTALLELGQALCPSWTVRWLVPGASSTVVTLLVAPSHFTPVM